MINPPMNQLKQSGQSSMDPARVARMRHEVLQTFDRVTFSMPEPSTRHQPYWLMHKPMFATIIASLLVVIGFSTTAIANAAKPGDTLFGLDQAAERVRLALTLSAEGKAKYQAQIAEERIQERQELESENSAHAATSAEISDQALNNAIDTIVEVRTKLEDRENPGKAVEALQKVEDHLRALRGDTHDEPSDDQTEEDTIITPGRSPDNPGKDDHEDENDDRDDDAGEVESSTGARIQLNDSSITTSAELNGQVKF